MVSKEEPELEPIIKADPETVDLPDLPIKRASPTSKPTNYKSTSKLNVFKVAQGLKEEEYQATIDTTRPNRKGSDVFRRVYLDRQKNDDSTIPYITGIQVPNIGFPRIHKYYEYHDSDSEEEHCQARKRVRKKNYTFQFKMMVVKEALKTTPFQSADKFHITYAQVYQWHKKFIKQGPQAFLITKKKKSNSSL